MSKKGCGAGTGASSQRRRRGSTGRGRGVGAGSGSTCSPGPFSMSTSRSHTRTVTRAVESSVQGGSTAVSEMPVVPSSATLRKYGLTLGNWIAILERQGGVCPVCDRLPASGRLVVDHRHVYGWKKMPPEERRKWVRGLLCVTCNHFILTRYGTPDKFRRAAAYLEDFEKRREVSEQC